MTSPANKLDPSHLVTTLNTIAGDQAYPADVRAAAGRRAATAGSACQTVRSVHSEWAIDRMNEATDAFYAGPPRTWGPGGSALVTQLARLALESLAMTGIGSAAHTGIEQALATGDTQRLASLVRGEG